MQTILFFSTDKELLKAVGAVELKHCKLILINNIKYIFHNAEEHQPRYVIFDHENDNTGEILKFISAYSDLKVIITAGKKDYHFKNVKTGTVYNNVSLINTGDTGDFIRILYVIDNLESSEAASSKASLKYINSFCNYKFLKQQVLSFYSIQGGAGKTTVALNLAWILKELAGVKILFIDLNFSQGPSDLTLKLNLPLSCGLGYFIERFPDGNTAFHNSIFRIKGSGLYILQSPSSLFLSDRFNIDLLNELLYLARKEFNIIIADVANRTDNIYLEMLNLSTTVFFLASAENTQIMRINMFLNILQNGQKKGIIVNDRSVEKPDKKLIKNISGLSEIPVIGLISGRNESRLKFLKINGINTGIIDVREQITELLDYVILS